MEQPKFIKTKTYFFSEGNSRKMAKQRQIMKSINCADCSSAAEREGSTSNVLLDGMGSSKKGAWSSSELVKKFMMVANAPD